MEPDPASMATPANTVPPQPTQAIPTPVVPLPSPSDDPTSQFFLHPSDNPGAKIILDVLDGTNYISWSKSVHMALAVKHKSGFIDGTISPPSDLSSANYVAWYRANSLVLSWLLNSISAEIRSSLLYFSSARDVWEELRVRFVKSDGPRVFHLEKSLSTLSQDNLSVTAFYNHFKGLWDEYVNYRSVPRCTCGVLAQCSCQLLQNLAEKQQHDSVLKFLIGLNDSFASVRSQILLMSPIPPLNKVYSLLLQEESQRSLTSFDDKSVSQTDSIACLAKQAFNKERKRPICDHCGYTGHTIDKCFQLVGYPPNWKGPKGPKKATQSNSNADSNKPSKANDVASDQNNVPSQNTEFLTPEFYQQFLSFVKTQSAKDVASSSHSADVALTQDDQGNGAGSNQQYSDWIC